MSKKPKDWYKQIVLRPVVHVDGYASYEKVCSYVANSYFSRDEESLKTGIKNDRYESRYIPLYTLFKVGQAKCPAYWVASDLLEALLQSSLTVEAQNLNWAMKTGIFMLPKNVILSPENKSINAIYWYYDTEKNTLLWACNDNDSAFYRKLPLNAYKIYIDSQDIDPSAVNKFNEYLQSIFLRLILIMQCRPELIDAADTQQKITVNRGFGKAQAQDLYQPLWIGQGYRLKHEATTVSSGDAENKQGGSKRPHWRKGFIRNQPYGEGRRKTKLVWIEPVLVMGGE
ncbi:MAG: hypothetical protein VKN72_27520 [Nostocales cyanobacterium 94392]|nr:hypothetical protein [Nostocales cyanobacterium 94392]